MANILLTMNTRSDRGSSGQIHIFWSAFDSIFPFQETEPLTQRPDERTRLRRSVHRQKVVLRDPGSLLLVAEDEGTKEILGWAGYVRPEACRSPHPWITEDEALKTDEDREAWEGVDRKHFNSGSPCRDFRRQRTDGSDRCRLSINRFVEGMGRIQVENPRRSRPLASRSAIFG